MSACVAPPQHLAGRAFDTIAARYDDMFTNSLIGRAQRSAVWAVMRQTFQRGDHVLELNCGTGEDALFLAGLGASVFACDASEKMISVANRRREIEGSNLPVRFEVLPMEHIGDASIFGPFDGVLSNFSGINCVADVATVGQQLASLLKPGGRLLLCVSSRVCLWETLWFLIRGRVSRGFRRWGGRSTASLGMLAVDVRYPTVGTLRRLLSPSFVMRSWKGIGITVPPSYVEHMARRHPRVLAWLAAVDNKISTWPVLRGIGDHVLLLFERTPS